MSDDKQLVALYNFDPSKIDWPFKRQKPLPLQTGETIRVMYDDGSDWLLGMLVSDPTQKGYFPKNYTVTLHEYYELMKEYAEESDGSEASDEVKPPKETLPAPSAPSKKFKEMANRDEEESDDDDDDYDELKPHPAIGKHPPLSSQPPIPTTLSEAKSKLLKDMPAIAQEMGLEPGGVGTRDITLGMGDLTAAVSALEDRAKEQEERDSLKMLANRGQISDTRASTPATYTAIRPPRDFVKSHMTVEMQANHLRDVQSIPDLVKEKGFTEFHPSARRPIPYQADLRVRATTCRIAAGIEPPHMRIAIEKARACGARWSQMFRPGLNDIVNETLKMGSDPCILSNLYMYDYEAREQFMRQHIRDVKGTLWFELQRRKQHLFYMRMDFVDLIMFHPDAWGFPDAMQNVVGAPEGGALHGWYAQRALDNDQEMEEAIFSYKVRQRRLPSHTFQALALGKVPEWVQQASEIHAETQAVEDLEAVIGITGDDNDGADTEATDPDATETNLPPEAADNQTSGDKAEGDEKKKVKSAAKGPQLTTQQLLEAGLGDEEDVYLKVNDDKFVRQRSIGPDVLDTVNRSYKLKGANAMRLFLRSRGAPDKTSNMLPISPKQIKDVAAQLGILGNYHFYSYCLFALRYPLPPHWDVVIKNDVRWYINLETELVQPIHPMVDQFREHLSDWQANDFLWDYRGFVKIKCSECGIPDSVVWCAQCTDYFCIDCFQKLHKSKRGRRHYPMPVPGSRYLRRIEVDIMKEYVPMLNVGFSHRRRFLARDNQSDKHGYDGGDKWLYFARETFEQALAITPEKHYFLQRLNPPRLGSNADGFYYNFKEEIICDDPGHIIQKAREQKALIQIQRFVRGALVRFRVYREIQAALVIQKYKRMWDCQAIFGRHGSNAVILRGWYRKFKAREEKKAMNARAAQIQALFRGKIVRIGINDRNLAATKIQACFRSAMCRHGVMQFHRASDTLQRVFRAILYGKKPVKRMNEAASRIQAACRGQLSRTRWRKMTQGIVKSQAVVRGFLARALMRKMQKDATKIQSHWRRWQEQLEMKMRLFTRIEEIYGRRAEVMREKLQDLAAIMIQRNFRRHKAYEYYVKQKREKAEADKRISTVLVSCLIGCSHLKSFIHPWFRHLPPEIQEVLEQIKASLQRTLGLTRISGKLANEELGRRSKRTTAKDLVLDPSENDLGTHMMVTIVHHLLSHIPNDVFPATVKWCAYTLSHLATDFLDHGAHRFEDIMLGKQPDMPVPPRPGEPLESLDTDYCHIKHHHDRVMKATPENLGVLFLDRLPQHQRHVYLTAEILITTRQALDLASLSTDDHFAFQGVDATVGAQLMDVLSKEMGVRMPSDWPKTHGTVYALASQMCKFVATMPGNSDGPNSPNVSSEALNPLLSRDSKTVLANDWEGERLSFFNRPACLRIVQQLGYLMREQDDVVNYIRNKSGKEGEASPSGKDKDKKEGEGGNVRQSRFISVIDRLFGLAYKAKHDHCPFVLAVVLFHMLSRGLMLRTFYHRASVVLQSKYRYYKQTTQRKLMLAPAMMIQRFWRGVRTALESYNKLNAVEMLQHNLQASKRKKRNAVFYSAVLKIQRLWRGAIARRWVRKLHKAATVLQKYGRRMLVSVVYNKEGRRLAMKLKAESMHLFQKTSTMTETEFLARKASLLAKTRILLQRQRDRSVDYRRMVAMHGQSKLARQKKKDNRERMRGSIQPERDTWSEPLSFGVAARLKAQQKQEILAGERAIGGEGSSAGMTKSAILSLTENAKRALYKTMPIGLLAAKKTHALQVRGLAVLQTKRLSKRPENPEVAEESLINHRALSTWETTQFKTSIPWLPKTIGIRLTEPHQQENLRSMYFLGTAFWSGFLARTDYKRPNGWFARMQLPKPMELPQDAQEHLANAAKIITAKVNQDVTTLNTQHLTPWRKALLSVLVIWKSVFSHAGARMSKPVKALPVLLMNANESIFTVANFLLAQLWNETRNQFTTKENRYRGIKSRPKWDIIENLEFDCVAKRGGFGFEMSRSEQKAHQVSSANSVKAANLQDYLEECAGLRFMVDLLVESTKDAELYMDAQMKRKEKSKKTRRAPKGQQQTTLTAAEQQRVAIENFTMSSLTNDTEVRAISTHVGLYLQSLEGKDAHLQGFTCVAHLMLACWRGLQPLFEASALRCIAEIDARHIEMKMLPPPKPEHPDDGLNTSNFWLNAESYICADKERSHQILNAAPTAILALVCRLQANFKGFMMRTRYLTRLRTIAAYCKDLNWPQPLEDAQEDPQSSDLDKFTRRAERKADGVKTLDEKIATYKPTVSQFLGGQGLEADQKLKELKRPGAKEGSPKHQAAKETILRDSEGGALPMESLANLPQVRVTADHRACADLYAVYMYNIYRRKEMAKIWRALAFAYDTVLKNFVSLLEKNSSLKPMVESVAAQLRRGKAVGFSKAYVPKAEAGAGGDAMAPGRMKILDSELFPRQSQTVSTKDLRDEKKAKEGPKGRKAPWEDDDEEEGAAKAAAKKQEASGSAAEPEEEQASKLERKPDPNAIHLSGDYLTKYLEETNGDDSQFKDIEPSVIPYSTGTSPRRERPDEFLFREFQNQQTAAKETAARTGEPLSLSAAGMDMQSLMGKLEGPGNVSQKLNLFLPNVNVEWCKDRIKSMWLPIKAHRFTACRSKVLQLLPQKQLQQYVDHEKGGFYAACIKLLETCIPGNLNIFQPSTLVPNKPLLIETIFQLLVGYIGLCLKNGDSAAASRLCMQTLDAMGLALKDLHPAHRCVLEAYLFDTALSVAYYTPTDVQLAAKAESFFQQASQRYLKLQHINRFAKCCVRYASVLHAQNHFHEAEYFIQQALNKLTNAPVCSLLVVCYHNLCVETAVQDRIADSASHMRTYISLLRQMSKLSNQWIQRADNSQWLVLKMQELWPAYQAKMALEN